MSNGGRRRATGAGSGSLLQNYTRTVRDDGTEVVRRREKESGGGGLPPGQRRPPGSLPRTFENPPRARIHGRRLQPHPAPCLLDRHPSTAAEPPSTAAEPPASPTSDGSVAAFVEVVTGCWGERAGCAGPALGVPGRRPAAARFARQVPVARYVPAGQHVNFV